MFSHRAILRQLAAPLNLAAMSTRERERSRSRERTSHREDHRRYREEKSGRDRSRSPRRATSRDRDHRRERDGHRDYRPRSRSKEREHTRRDSRSRSRSRQRRQHDSRSRSRSRSRDRRDKHKRRRSRSLSSSSEESEEGRKRRKKEKKHKRRDSSKERRKDKKKKKEKKKEQKGSSSHWGKYGIISEIDLYTKGAEFHAWLVEERKINPETLSKDQEKKEFARFVEDYNTATLPQEKFYDMEKYERRMNALRQGEFLPPTDDGYDPQADLRALTSSHKRKAVEKESYMSRDQLEALRKVQNERTQVAKMKLLGMDISQTLGVRMDGTAFDDI